MKSAVILSALLFALSACENRPPSYDAATGGNPQRGREAIVSYGCGACHKIGGIPNAYGLVGPSLQDIGERSYVGGNLPNSPENLETWIRHPRQIDPHAAMPDLNVTETDARDITAYLYHQ
jgi:cytochrome c